MVETILPGTNFASIFNAAETLRLCGWNYAPSTPLMMRPYGDAFAPVTIDDSIAQNFVHPESLDEVGRGRDICFVIGFTGKNKLLK